MEHVQVIFNRRFHLGSLALRTILWSAWSHCAIIDGDYVLEATAPYGVRRRLLSDMLAESTKYDIVSIPVNSAQAVLEAARSEIGKPYDWLGVVGIGVRRRWQSDARWFCSEYIAWAFETGGSPLFRVSTYRITPRDLAIPDWQRPRPTLTGL